MPTIGTTESKRAFQTPITISLVITTILNVIAYLLLRQIMNTIRYLVNGYSSAG